MKQTKWEKRDKKRQKKKNGMRTDGRSVFLSVEIINKKAEKAKKEREEK